MTVLRSNRSQIVCGCAGTIDVPGAGGHRSGPGYRRLARMGRPDTELPDTDLADSLPSASAARSASSSTPQQDQHQRPEQVPEVIDTPVWCSRAMTPTSSRNAGPRRRRIRI